MRKIAIIGHYGADTDLCDGQTVKIKSLVSAIQATRPDVNLKIVDTYYMMNSRKLYFCWLLLSTLLTTKHIIFLPAARGRLYMFKFFYYVGKVMGKKLYHDCIAGSLDEELIEHPIWIKYLNSFEYNWMESPEQVEKLKRMGVINAEFLPNFKNLQPVIITDSIKPISTKTFKFCIFSRVLPMKGIEDAMEAIECLHEKKGVDVYLDIYGPIEKGQEEWFEKALNKYSNICSYKGVVQFEKSVDVLKDYFALLFPTRFYTEGMPGTIIDAMFAGLPVIARRWAWCDNMITNGVNGISYDFEHPELLNDILERIIDNPQIIFDMKKNCVKKAEEYSPKKICQRIFEAMS